MSGRGAGGKDMPETEGEPDVDRMMRWLRLAADVIERGGGKKGGERVADDTDAPTDESAT